MCLPHNLLFVSALLLAGAAVPSLSGCATANTGGSGAGTKVIEAPYEAGGVRVVRISPAVGGQMLDLRYRITDAEQAGRILKKSTRIFLVDQVSGQALPVPDMAQVGMLRSLPNKGEADRLFWIFFNNSEGVVKPGHKVTLVIGDVAIKDIVVE